MAKKIRKRAVSIIMLNGESTGVLEVTILGSQSMIYKIPRDELSNCKILGVNDFNSVYFLFGENGKEKPKVYIGQAGVRNTGSAILARLSEHDKRKEFWSEAIVFTNTNDMFGATELNFLENQFCNMAMEAKRYDVQNGNNPNQGNIRRREAELEPYLDDAETLLSILGYKVFEPLDEAYLEKGLSVPHEETNIENNESSSFSIPELPSNSLRVGEFIKSSMINLQESGYDFTDEQLAILTDWNQCKSIFNLQAGSAVPFLKKYDPEEDKPHVVNGVNRYYAPKSSRGHTGLLLHFGGADYMLTKEWYDKYHHREYFINWYESLKA